MKKIIAGLFLMGSCWSALAQSTECEQTLSLATDEFNAGHFYEIPALLKSCLDKKDFTDEQRVRAYLLLSQAYMIIDDPIAAEDSYLKLLKADPEYIATKEKDPIDVVYLSTKFTSTPIFTPHVRVGANTSFVRTIADLSTDSKSDKTKNILKPGFQFGGGVDWNITDNISLCADGIFSYKGFKKAISRISNDDQLTISYKQYWVDIPVYLKYSVSKGQIRPFAYAGFAANLLLGSKAQLQRENISPSTKSEAPTEGPDVSLTYLRRIFNRSFVLGGGVRYKIGRDYLFADIRYMAGLSNLTKSNVYSPDPKSNSTLATNTNLTNYGYVDSYFRVDNLSLSVGYVKPLYYPRKVKRAKSKGVLRKIRKEENAVK